MATKKYVVEITHFRPCWRKGDLEDEFVNEQPQYFSTQKEAKSFVERTGAKPWGKGSKAWIWSTRFTGKKWVNENTGKECEEFYRYITKKL